MATDDSATQGPGDSTPLTDDLSTFRNLLNELKATGCNLLVVGDAPREVFTRASARLLGDEQALRYRVLAVTDATAASVADRLPDPDVTPRPLSATTCVLDHAGTPRSVTAAGASPVPEAVQIDETRTADADPELRELRSRVTDAIEDAAGEADRLRPADLRVGVDSLDPLLEQHGVGAVDRYLDAVGERVRDHGGMAHYVLTHGYDSDPVQELLPSADAAIELRTASPGEFDHDAEQRWHVPQCDITTEWTPL